MARTRATVRRMPITMPPEIGNKNILNRRLGVLPFKIKKYCQKRKQFRLKKADRKSDKLKFDEKRHISQAKQASFLTSIKFIIL